ncbi:MAG: hypothetical protein ACRDTH_27420 [Pseudonocardiaceae bacterium]
MHARSGVLRPWGMVSAIAAAALVGLVTAYAAVVRPWLLTWGATPEETRASMPGDVETKYALEPVHWLMERRMLLGIKQRAERYGGRQS